MRRASRITAGTRYQAGRYLSSGLVLSGALCTLQDVTAAAEGARPADVRLLAITVKDDAAASRPLLPHESLHAQEAFQLRLLVREAAFLYVVSQSAKGARTLWPPAPLQPVVTRFATGVTRLPQAEVWMRLDRLAPGDRVCVLASTAALAASDQVCDSGGRGDDQPPPPPPAPAPEPAKPVERNPPPDDTSGSRGKGNPKAHVIVLPVQF